MRHALTALALLTLAGCGGPLPQTATLPRDAVDGATDPLRGAIISSAYAFNNPGGLADPWVAARAAANLEFLAVSLPWEARLNYTPTVNLQLAAARDEMHAALGVAPGASPQAVVDGLYNASRALRLRDAQGAEAALLPAVFPNRGATLARLASLGPLPLSATATAMAEGEQMRAEQDRVNTFGGGDAGGRN